MATNSHYNTLPIGPLTVRGRGHLKEPNINWWTAEALRLNRSHCHLHLWKGPLDLFVLGAMLK